MTQLKDSQTGSAETRYQRLFETAQDGILILNSSGKIFDANPFFLALTGFSLNEIAGKALWELGFIADKQRAEQAFRDTLEKGFVRYEDLPLRHKGGNALDVEFVCNSYLVAEELVIQCNIRDITERVRVSRLLIEEQRLRDLAQTRLTAALNAIIEAMSKTMERRDPYTSGHQKRVADISVLIGTKMGFTHSQLQALHIAGLVHDLGKIAVPSEILTKPGALTPIERQLVEEHVAVGYEILKDIPFDWPIAEMVRQHHERLDGSGYPRGLHAQEISLEARVLSVADILESMNSHRPYRAALSLETARQEIASLSGSALDAEVVSAALEVFAGLSDVSDALPV